MAKLKMVSAGKEGEQQELSNRAGGAVKSGKSFGNLSSS